MSQEKKNGTSAAQPDVVNGRINGRFAPGYSGNPGGRGKRSFEITRVIQQRLDPDEWFNIMIAIMRGQGVRVMDGGSYAPNGPVDTTVPIQMPGVKDQLKAAGMLADLGFIKPPTQKQLAIDAGRARPAVEFDESRLSDDQITALIGILETVRALPSGE